MLAKDVGGDYAQYASKPEVVRNKVEDIQLSRERIEFGCDGPIDSIPSERRTRDPYPTVSYEAYDAYHRYGKVKGQDGEYLQSYYHVTYDNGQTCNSTRTVDNRVQFLLNDRQVYPTGLSRFPLFSSPAVADPVTLYRYNTIHVRMANYQKSTEAPGCFSFPLRTTGDQITIGLADLEDKSTLQTVKERARLDEWVIEVAHN